MKRTSLSLLSLAFFASLLGGGSPAPVFGVKEGTSTEERGGDTKRRWADLQSSARLAAEGKGFSAEDLRDKTLAAYFLEGAVLRYYLSGEFDSGREIPGQSMAQDILDNETPDLWTRMLAAEHARRQGLVPWRLLPQLRREELVGEATNRLHEEVIAVMVRTGDIGGVLAQWKDVSNHAQTLYKIFIDPSARKGWGDIEEPGPTSPQAAASSPAGGASFAPIVTVESAPRAVTPHSPSPSLQTEEEEKRPETSFQAVAASSGVNADSSPPVISTEPAALPMVADDRRSSSPLPEGKEEEQGKVSTSSGGNAGAIDDSTHHDEEVPSPAPVLPTGDASGGEEHKDTSAMKPGGAGDEEQKAQDEEEEEGGDTSSQAAAVSSAVRADSSLPVVLTEPAASSGGGKTESIFAPEKSVGERRTALTQFIQTVNPELQGTKEGAQAIIDWLNGQLLPDMKLLDFDQIWADALRSAQSSKILPDRQAQAAYAGISTMLDFGMKKTGIELEKDPLLTGIRQWLRTNSDAQGSVVASTPPRPLGSPLPPSAPSAPASSSSSDDEEERGVVWQEPVDEKDLKEAKRGSSISGAVSSSSGGGETSTTTTTTTAATTALDTPVVNPPTPELSEEEQEEKAFKKKKGAADGSEDEDTGDHGVREEDEGEEESSAPAGESSTASAFTEEQLSDPTVQPSSAHHWRNGTGWVCQPKPRKMKKGKKRGIRWSNEKGWVEVNTVPKKKWSEKTGNFIDTPPKPKGLADWNSVFERWDRR